MRECSGYSCSAIEQIYLPSAPGITHRIRRRLTAGRSIYTETVKTRLSSMSCIEEEKEIPREEYSRLKGQRDLGRRIVKKNRHTFVYGEQTFEIDIYPFRKNSCVMETELKSEMDRPELPPFIKVVKEVTGDHRYSNAALAKKIPADWKEGRTAIPRRPRNPRYAYQHRPPRREENKPFEKKDATKN
jgi:CYTH domain-containing protein